MQTFCQLFIFRAIDGLTDPNWGGSTCTHTDLSQSGAWWQVELPGTFTVTRVKLYNRIDCCSTDPYIIYILTILVNNYAPLGQCILTWL